MEKLEKFKYYLAQVYMNLVKKDHIPSDDEYNIEDMIEHMRINITPDLKGVNFQRAYFEQKEDLDIAYLGGPGHKDDRGAEFLLIMGSNLGLRITRNLMSCFPKIEFRYVIPNVFNTFENLKKYLVKSSLNIVYEYEQDFTQERIEDIILQSILN